MGSGSGFKVPGLGFKDQGLRLEFRSLSQDKSYTGLVGDPLGGTSQVLLNSGVLLVHGVLGLG